MMPRCLSCDLGSQDRTNIIRFGSFYRTSDSQFVQRFRCANCKSTFSVATFHPCFGQKKRHRNETIRRLLAKRMSQRGCAEALHLNRKTVVRKFRFLAARARIKMAQDQKEAEIIEFDDLETFEHTKCKPLSVILAVEHSTRRILGLKVSSMPAKGRLVHRAQRYGFRRDNRRDGRRALFAEIKRFVKSETIFKSDSNPHYERDMREFFPECRYQQFLGKRGASTGQGELKKLRFDPLFSLNHTCAVVRDNVSRLTRKTWCTTKNADQLEAHLILYAQYHNERLERRRTPKTTG